jgi:hypothetical protein
MPEMPGYEVEIRPVAAPRRGTILPVVAGLLIAGLAVGASLLTSHPSAAGPIVIAPSQESDLSAPSASALVAPAPPASVDCGALRAYDCSEAIDAARLAIADAPTAIASAKAWPTLICGDNFDCPLSLLQAGHPLGSVALTLADRGVVWINVFRVREPNRLDENREVLDTRVVRWFRAPA